MANQSLKGKVVVVGAGAKNLGGLISKTFGADGASVVVHYHDDSAKASADETVKAVKAAGGDAFAIQGSTQSVECSRSRSLRPPKRITIRCSPSTPKRRTSSFARRRST